MNSSIKVGIISIIGFALLAVMVFYIGDIHFSERGYRLTVTFYQVAGLTEGATVKLAGVTVGKVERIEIRDDIVYVHTYIKDAATRIRIRSTFTIGTAGLMGEKFVEIIPTRDQTAPYVQKNTIVAGTDPTRMEELFEQGNELLKKLQELTASAKDVVGDPEIKRSTQRMFKNAEAASEKLTAIVESVQAKADKIVGNIDSIMAKVNDEIDINRENLRAIVANVKDFSKRIADIGKENQATLKEMLSNFEEMSARLDRMVAELEKDHVMTDHLKETVASIKDASNNAKEISAEVKSIVFEKDIKSKIKGALDDAHKIAQAVDKVFLNIKQTRLDFKYLLRYHKEDEMFFSDMMVDIWPSDNSYYRIGVEDIGGDPLFNLMLAKDANNRLVKRAGVISSKVGVGVDYKWAEDITYSVDVIDTRKSQTRFTTSYAVRPGMQFQLRVDDVTDKKNLNFAIEYKF